MYLVPGLITFMTAKSYDVSEAAKGQSVQPPLPAPPAHQAGLSKTLR